MLGVPGQVVADIQIEVAVAVEVGEGGRGRPVARTAQSGAIGRVLERAVAPVVQQEIRPEPRDEQVGPAVVVVVAGGHAEAISAADPRDARARPSRPRTCRRRGCGTGGRPARAGIGRASGGKGPPWTR